MRWRQAGSRPREVALDEAPEPVARDDEQPNLDEVLTALAALSFNQRAAIVMRELEGRSYQEISGVLGVSVSAVEALLFRARRNLQVRRGALGVLTTVPLPGSLASFIGGGGGAAVAGSTVVRRRPHAQGGSRRRRGRGDRRRRLRGRQVGAGYACRNAGGVRRAEARVHAPARRHTPSRTGERLRSASGGRSCGAQSPRRTRPQSHGRPGPSSSLPAAQQQATPQSPPPPPAAVAPPPCRSPCRSCRRCRRSASHHRRRFRRCRCSRRHRRCRPCHPCRRSSNPSAGCKIRPLAASFR